MISVIIPVYNTASYLEECIQSVVKQTYKDWECLLVNDGSTDGSGKICDGWACKDSRIKVIHQSNEGVSSARNRGIEVSQGEFIAFIDSDDWVEQNYLEALYNMIQLGESDLCVCGLSIYQGGKTVKEVVPPTGLCMIQSTDTDFFLQIESQNFLFGPVNKIYHKKIIDQNEIRFDLLKDYGEDLEFNFAYLRFTKCISTLSQPLYHYRITDGSRLSTKFRKDLFKINYEHWLLMQRFHMERSLCNNKVSTYMYGRLWGTIYDGLFLLTFMKSRSFSGIYRYVRDIVSIPEIEDEEFRNNGFCASRWIRWLIMHRFVWLLTLYFYLRK